MNDDREHVTQRHVGEVTGAPQGWGWSVLRAAVRATWLRCMDPPYRRAMAEQLAELVGTNGEVLDVGCGDGSMGASLMANNPQLEVCGIDVVEVPDAQIDVTLYDGSHIPFEDNSFDLVMATDVLHHTLDIGVVLTEMTRVSRRYVLIKDHAVYGPISRGWISLIDYVTNVPFGIPCVYNYPSLDGWHRYFDETGLEIESDQMLQIGPGSHLHPVFKLLKTRTYTDPKK